MPDRSVAYVFKGNFTNLTAGLTVAGKNVQELGGKLTALDKDGRKARAGLTELGSAAGKVGLVAAAGLGAAVLTAAKFDKAMSAVQAATHETAGNMTELRDAAIKAGAATVYSASEAAGAIEELAKAGVSTTDILDGGLSGSLDLAAAGAIDVADAAELAATAMTQFSLSGDKVNHVADLLAAGAGKAQGSVDDLGMALKQSGLVAAQSGLSIEDTVGTLSAFASAGLLGSDAGTSFKTMLQSLTPTSKTARDKMAELGISAYDAQGNFVGITNFAGQLQEALARLSPEAQNTALKIIFGSDAVRAASVLYQQGATGIQGWIDKTNDAGYAAETAATRLDNLSGDLEQLKGSLETALIGAGDGAQGPLRSLVQGTTEVVNGLAAIPKPAQNAAAGLLGITAVLGGGLWFGSKVINAVSDMTEALGQLGITADTTKGKVAAIGTAGAAAALGMGTFLDTMGQLDSWNRSNEAADATVKSFQDLSDALSFSNVGKYASDLHINLGRLTQDLAENGEQGEYVQRVLEDLGGSSHGLSALLQSEAGNILPFYTDGATKAYDANKDLKAIIDETSGSLVESSDATAEAGGAFAEFGTKAAAAVGDMVEFNKAIEKSRKAATQQAQAIFNLGDSLDDTKVSLGDWIKDLREQADALHDFRVNAETAAKKGLRDGLIAALQAAGPEGALRMKQLSGATKKEIAAANSAWQSGQREINKYVDAVGGVPKTAGTELKVNAGQAFDAIAAMKYALRNIPDETVNVNIYKRGAIDVATRANGGPIYGPGTGTSDSIPAYLSNGEFVMRAGAVSKYGMGFMHAINAERFADGGAPGSKGLKPYSYSLGNDFAVVRPSVGSAVAALMDLRKTIHGLSGDIRESERTIKRETKQRDAATEVVRTNQAEVDRLTGLYDGLSSQIQAGLAASQFATVEASRNPWAAGAHGERPPTFDEIMGRLNTSTTNANDFVTATGTLTANGLSGAALQSVLGQGLSTAQMFASLTPAQLSQYQSTFDTNAAAVAAAGAAAGNAVFGAEMEKANQILASSQAELMRQTVELNTHTAQLATAERQRDKAEKILGDVKDYLGDIRTEIKAARGAAHSGHRSQR